MEQHPVLLWGLPPHCFVLGQTCVELRLCGRGLHLYRDLGARHRRAGGGGDIALFFLDLSWTRLVKRAAIDGDMRGIIAALCALVVFAASRLEAQTEIKRYNATPDNSYGVRYQLPKTGIEIQATLREVSYTPGVFAPWAELHLSQTPDLRAHKRYELVEVSLRSVGIPDESKQYLVTFDKKTIAPFISLTPEGIIYSINGGQLQGIEPPAQPQYTDTIPTRGLPSLPKEYSLATTQHRQAAILASYLYEVRESLMGIVMGSAEHLPKDGESMRLMLEQLRGEERKALALFLGDTTIRYTTHTWRISPELEDMNARELCRFSPEEGIMMEGGSVGQPLLFDLAIELRYDQLSEKEQKKLEKLDGIIYNVPGMGVAKVRLGDGQPIATARVSLPQVGTIQSLAKKMFNVVEGRTTAVYFDTTTGEVQSVRNE